MERDLIREEFAVRKEFAGEEGVKRSAPPLLATQKNLLSGGIWREKFAGEEGVKRSAPPRISITLLSFFTPLAPFASRIIIRIRSFLWRAQLLGDVA